MGRSPPLQSRARALIPHLPEQSPPSPPSPNNNKSKEQKVGTWTVTATTDITATLGAGNNPSGRKRDVFSPVSYLAMGRLAHTAPSWPAAPDPTPALSKRLLILFDPSATACTCSDTKANGDETDVDCGGGCAAKCADGKRCLNGADCTSGVCGSNWRCAAGTGSPCSSPADCISGVCPAGTCAASDCNDGVKNGNEAGVDCGSASGCGRLCADGGGCATAADCASGVCTGSGYCKAPTCSDGVKNGNELGVDCGNVAASACGGCADGALCLLNSDCTSQRCNGTTCSAPTCSDGVKNGLEGGTDCGSAAGGSGCGLCSDAAACSASADCASGVCAAAAGGGGSTTCAAPTCSDGVKNGGEADVD